MSNVIVCRQPGLVDYQSSYAAMASYTSERNEDSRDEIWLLQHPAVYTLGLAGKAEHILNAGSIPVIKTDRGGQVTYHGPGQLVVYLLLDLRRLKIGIRDYVNLLEQSLIDYLLTQNISAMRVAGAPGVYVDGSKVAALGIRMRRGCCYHGLALNVHMDTLPFRNINPCGYPDLQVTQLADLNGQTAMDEVADALLGHLVRNIYNKPCKMLNRLNLPDAANDEVAT